jgi:valyl-tRNA synthetase
MMETGYISILLVARMIMSGMYFTADSVQSDLSDGLVRDEHGKKMCKSKGNVVDPLTVMDELEPTPSDSHCWLDRQRK